MERSDTLDPKSTQSRGEKMGWKKAWLPLQAACHTLRASHCSCASLRQMSTSSGRTGRVLGACLPITRDVSRTGHAHKTHAHSHTHTHTHTHTLTHTLSLSLSRARARPHSLSPTSLAHPHQLPRLPITACLSPPLHVSSTALGGSPPLSAFPLGAHGAVTHIMTCCTRATWVLLPLQAPATSAARAS